MTPRHTTGELESTIEALTDGEWHSAREINSVTAISPRKLRSIAEHTGLIIGGQDGYKLTEAATVDELQHSVRALFSRARKIDKRACELNAVINERLMTKG